MARPVIPFGESLFVDFATSGVEFRNIPVPSVMVYHTKRFRYMDFDDEESPEFKEFLWECYEKHIPVTKVEDFIRENAGLNIDLYKRVYNRDPDRLETVRQSRRISIMDDVEQGKLFDSIPKTPEEMMYANMVNKSKLAIVNRVNKDYKEKSEQKIDFTGNLAKIVIEPKDGSD